MGLGEGDTPGWDEGDEALVPKRHPSSLSFGVDGTRPGVSFSTNPMAAGPLPEARPHRLPQAFAPWGGYPRTRSRELLGKSWGSSSRCCPPGLEGRWEGAVLGFRDTGGDPGSGGAEGSVSFLSRTEAGEPGACKWRGDFGAKQSLQRPGGRLRLYSAGERGASPMRRHVVEMQRLGPYHRTARRGGEAAGPQAALRAVPRQRGERRSSTWAPTTTLRGGEWGEECGAWGRTTARGEEGRAGGRGGAPHSGRSSPTPPMTPRALWLSPPLPLPAPPQRSAPRSLVGLPSPGWPLMRMRSQRGLPALIGQNRRKDSGRSRPMDARCWLRAEGRARVGGRTAQRPPQRSRRADWAGLGRPYALIGGAPSQGGGRLDGRPAHPRPRCPPPLACREGTGEGKGRDVSARPRPPFCSETAEERG